MSNSIVFNDSAASASHRPGGVWRFAGREFDESRLELRVDGKTVDLELKPLEVLIQFLQHAGEIVTREELLDAVWPGLAVVEGSLSTAVYKLRKALADEDSCIIVTVPRVGYRIHAPSLSYAPGPSGSLVEPLSITPDQSIRGRAHWRLIRRLDASSKSDVWLAEHTKTRVQRVFKFAAPNHLKALKREVTVFRFLLESLGDRPDLVRIFDWNFDQEPYFIESEYGGLNLADWAKKGGLNIASVDRVQLVAGIAETVAAVHRAGVLHKDLKPANILVDPAQEGSLRLRLADFGSASLVEFSRLKELGITALGLTQTGAAPPSWMTGTLMYLAPEVLAGRAPSALSDVYALGVVLYQAVICDFAKPLAPGWESDVPEPILQGDIAAAVCGDPTRRIASADEFAGRLRNIEQRRVEEAKLKMAKQHEQMAEHRRTTARARRPLWVALAIAAVLLLVTGLLYENRFLAAPRQLKDIAVMPFQNASSDPDLNFLSQAVADDIATSLSYARGLSVRSFATNPKFGTPDLDLQKAGVEVNADCVVSGHFIKAGGDLELALEAIDVKTGRALWRDTVTARVAGLIDLREKLAAITQGPLAAALGVSAFSVDGSARPNNDEAYQLYLRAAAIPLDTSQNEQAIGMLEKSVGIDANFAPAWLMLSRKYYVEARYVTGKSAMMERANAAVRHAVSLDPQYVPAAAFLIGGYIEGGDLLRAIKLGDDLVHQHPKSADAHYILSYALRFAGMMEQAGAECDTAFRLDRHTQTSGLRSCAILFALSGKYERARDYLDLDPTSDFSKAILLSTLLRAGNETGALQLGAPHIPQWVSFDMLLACATRRPAQEIANVAAKIQVSEDPEANYLAAANLAYCGQNKQALQLLKVAVNGGYCSWPAMDSDPFFSRLHASPEFLRLRSAGMACRQRVSLGADHFQVAKQ